MLFLIEYDPPRRTTVTFRTFSDAAAREADKARLELELKCLREKLDHEVVVLGAKDEAALRRTHERYFDRMAPTARAVSEKHPAAA